jgi:NAD(P)-dependent dehydrogenase (short-subunit alcohol dehydrogenase family)
MKSLKVLIMGAAGGLGTELALLLAAEGASLLLVDKSTHKLDVLSDQIVEQGFEEPGVCTLDLAVSELQPFEGLAGILQSEYGGLDVFIHCAAEFDGLRPIEQITPDYWFKCMQVNVNSAWLAVTCLSPILQSSGRGRVVLIHEDKKVMNSAYWGAYGVSKASLQSLGTIMSEEFQGTRVEVLNIYPGPMRTSLRASAYLSEDPDSVKHPIDAAVAIVATIKESYPG